MNLAVRDDEGTLFAHVQVPEGATPRDIERTAHEAYLTYQAQKLGIDPGLAHGLARSESSMDPQAVGPATKSGDHAVGLLQLMPRTAAAHGVDPRNPFANVRAGLLELRQRLQRYSDPDVAVASYKGWDVGAHGNTVPPYREAVRQVAKARIAAEAWRQGQTPAAATAAARGEAEPDVNADAPETPAPQDNLLAQAGSGVAETAAGLLDLPQNAMTLLSKATGLPEPVPLSVAGAVAPHLAAEPQTPTGELVRAASGPAALGAATAGLGLVSGGVLAETALGASSGAGSLVGGKAAEAIGLPKPVGQLLGGALAPVAFTAGRVVNTALAGGRAAREAAEGATAKVAATAQAAAAKATAHIQTVEEETAARLTRVEQAARQESVTATKTYAYAKASADWRAADAARAVEGQLLQMPPEGRARLLRDAIRGHEQAFVEDRRVLYQGFMEREGTRPVVLDGLHIRAEDLIEQLIASGRTPDEATREAQRLLRVLAPPEGEVATTLGAHGEILETAIPAGPKIVTLEDAEGLRHDLGALFRKASGPAKARSATLFKALDQSIGTALKDVPKVAQELGGLRQVYRTELRLYRNRMLTRLLDDSEQGRAAAEVYTSKLLTGKWSPQKATELRQLLDAAGTNTTAHEVVKDAVLRQGLKQATRTTDGAPWTDWGLFAQTLRNPEGLAPAFTVAVKDPRERARLIQFAERAAAGRAEVEAAEAAIPKAPPPWLAEARAARKTVIKDATAQAKQTARETVLAARAEAAAAKARAPRRFTILDGLLAEDLYRHFGVKGALVGLLGRHVLRWARQGINRDLLREAARTSIDSTAGERMLRTLTAISARLHPDMPAGTFGPMVPAPAGAPTPAPSPTP